MLASMDHVVSSVEVGVFAASQFQKGLPMNLGTMRVFGVGGLSQYALQSQKLEISR